MKPGPDKVYGPQLTDILKRYASDVRKESGATVVRIMVEFTDRGGKGSIQIRTFTSPDTKTERMLDPDVPMPRGSKLQRDVTLRLRSVMSRLTKKLGGE